MTVISHPDYRAERRKAEAQATAFMSAWIKSGKEIDRLMTMLQEANDLLRSAHEVACREGRETNWPALQRQLYGALQKQHGVIVAYFTDDVR